LISGTQKEAGGILDKKLEDEAGDREKATEGCADRDTN